MSAHEHPIVDTGLFITPEIAAYINLYDDMHPSQPDQTMPLEIKMAVDKYGTAKAVIANERALLENYGYMDIDIAHDALDNLDIEHVYCNSFTGEVSSIGESANSIQQSFSDNFMVYVTTDRQPSVFNSGYGNIANIVDEFRKKFANILPDNFDIESHIVHVNGTDFS